MTKVKEEILIEAKKRKSNMRLYPYYIIFGYDMLFYYGIKVLYFSQVKNISDASIVLLSTVFALTSIIFLVLSTLINSKVGNKKTLIIGDGINIISIMVFILGNGITQIMLAQILSAAAFSMKNISFAPILNESIPNSNKKSDIFSRIDGKAYFGFCIFSAIATIAAGFLYDINPYIPMYLCLLCAIISEFISIKFKEIEEKVTKEQEIKKITNYVKELKDGFLFTIKSGRIRALLLSVGFIWGVTTLFSTYQMTLFKNIGVSASIIGIISMIQTIIKGYSGKFANKYNDGYKNKSLTYMSILIAIVFILIGIMSLIKIRIEFKLLIIVGISILMYILDGIYTILYKRYINNFTNSKVLPTIYSMNNVYCNFERVIINSIGSFVLAIATIDYGFIIMGIIFFISSILLQIYMKTRLGLRAEEYSEEDVKYADK